MLSASEITYFPITITSGAEKLKPGATATAASTTHLPILFDLKPEDLAASVVSVGASTTIYKIGCPLGEDHSNDCPLGRGYHLGVPKEPWLTMGQDFIGMNFSAPGLSSETLSCDVSSTSFVNCVGTASKSYTAYSIMTTVDGIPTPATVPGTEVTTTFTDQGRYQYGQVLVTGGVDKLIAASTSTTSAVVRSSSSSKGAAPKETGQNLLAIAAVAGIGLLV